MEGEFAVTRHFFSVMVPGFQNHLDLPSSFCEKLKYEKSKRAILKSRIGKWKVDVCSNRSNGLICFKNGWPQFVHQHGLSIGDFAVFEHTGGFHFNVSVFDHTACEKVYFPFESKKEHQENNKGESDNAASTESDNAASTSYHNRQNPHFVLTMKPCFAKKKVRVNIPAVFSRSENYLDGKSSLSLRDPNKRTWPVSLERETNGRSRVLMWRGWHDFYVANELKNGDVCVFELNDPSLQSTTALMDVRISRAGV